MVLLRVLLSHLLAVTALLQAVSCWSPVFDQNVSLAAVTSSKLSREAQFRVSVNDDSNTTYFALPSRERSPVSVVVFGVSTTKLGYWVWSNSGGSWGQVGNSGNMSFDSALSDPELVSFQAGTTDQGFSAAVYLPTLGGGVVKVVTAPNYSPTPMAFAAAAPSVLGLASYPTGVGQAAAYLLTYQSSALVVQGVAASSAFAGPAVNSGTQISLASYSGSAAYGWFAYDPGNDVAYFTHYALDSSGKYTTDGIVGTGIAASWNRKDHVVAFLSTNQLLTKEGSYYDVCDAQGNIAFTFPAGSLRFAGEYWDSDGTPRSAFTTVLPVEGGSSSSSSSMNVTIYSIPTKSLNTLK